MKDYNDRYEDALNKTEEYFKGLDSIIDQVFKLSDDYQLDEIECFRDFFENDASAMFFEKLNKRIGK